MNPVFRKYLSIVVLSIAGGSIYTLPYLKYVFYTPQLEVMGITNLQSGLLISMYGIVNLIFCVPGGIIADKFAPRTLLVISLLSTSFFGVLYAYVPTYSFSVVIWLLLSLSTNFLFWAALIKSIGMTGTREEQGHLYGLYYVGNGLSGALVNFLALKVFSYGSTTEQSFFYAVMFIAGSIFAAGILAFFCLKGGKGELTSEEDSFKMSAVWGLFKNPMLWCFSLVVYAGFSIFTSMSYFTPYLVDVMGISVEESGGYSVIRNYLFYMLCPLSGYIADRILRSTSKLFIVLFALTGLSIYGVMFLPATMSPALVSLYTLLPGAFGLMLYGIAFSVLRETNIPPILIGTAVALASFIGYTPDFFYSAMFGYWLDLYGNKGYDYIFTFLSLCCVLGMIMSFCIARWGSSDANLSKKTV